MTDPTARPESDRENFVPARLAARMTVLSGPSAVGKSTVVEAIRRNNPEIWLSVSATTRPPRPGEAHGREYFFVGEREFSEMAAAGQLLEWARYGGHFYGTPRAPVAERLAAGIPGLLAVDAAGARQVRAALRGALLVYLAPPGDDLVHGTENDCDITLVSTSVRSVCAQLVALITAQPVARGHEREPA